MHNRPVPLDSVAVGKEMSPWMNLAGQTDFESFLQPEMMNLPDEGFGYRGRFIHDLMLMLMLLLHTRSKRQQL